MRQLEQIITTCIRIAKNKKQPKYIRVQAISDARIYLEFREQPKYGKWALYDKQINDTSERLYGKPIVHSYEKNEN